MKVWAFVVMFCHHWQVLYVLVYSNGSDLVQEKIAMRANLLVTAATSLMLLVLLLNSIQKIHPSIKSLRVLQMR